jgi:hypothetical protein
MDTFACPEGSGLSHEVSVSIFSLDVPEIAQYM